MTNAEKLIADIDRLTELLYQADDFEDACQMEPNSTGEFLLVRPECNEPKGCIKCIKEWLLKEGK